MAIFSIHGTGISHSDHAYNADVWAYLIGELGRADRAQHRPPRRRRRGRGHARGRRARRPAGAAGLSRGRARRAAASAPPRPSCYERLEGELSAEVALAAAFRELDLATGPTEGGITLPPPAFGAATIAGAHENTTPVVHRIPPFRPNLPNPFARGPHGAKWIPGGRRLHDLLVPPATFPRVLPLQVLRIGPLAVVGLPFEVTVESGRRVEAAVHAALGPSASSGSRCRRWPTSSSAT